jgi:hypothetical protein
LKEQWRVNPSKCSFALQEITYLGYVINAKRVSTSPEKIVAVRQWPVTSSVKELRSFLGLAGYYRKFVENFGLIAKPLTDLLKKHVLFVWTSDHDPTFVKLKHALVNAPVLALPNFNKSFLIEIDASDKGVGAVLMQEGHPIAYVSKPLGAKLRGLSTYEKDYVTILLAVEKWRPYLRSAEFVIATN